MPALTRRRYPERLDCWHVYYGDVHGGTIARRVGCPHDEDPWEWSCGFYPGSRPRETQAGTAETFDAARDDFEAAWRVFLAGRTEADFQAWRYQRDSTAWKYAMWDGGFKLPTQLPTGQLQMLLRRRLDDQRRDRSHPGSACTHGSSLMKFAVDRPYANPETAARKLVETANAVEAVQDGRIYIELVNWPFLSEHKGSPAEYKAGLDLAIARGWLVLHESGTYVKFTQAGAELFA